MGGHEVTVSTRGKGQRGRVGLVRSAFVRGTSVFGRG